MSEHDQQDDQQPIPRWTQDFDASQFDVQAVFREAMSQKKSAFKVLKALGYPVKKFISHEVPAFSVAEKSGDELIPVTASSTAIDLSGDDFAESAIEEMQAAAKGTTVFLNHKYELPEDVYGKVEDCEIVARELFNPVTGDNERLTCWDLRIAPVGEEENPRAVRVSNMLQRSRLKLGVSVTVLVLKSVARKGGGRTIIHVFYIETSMVGIPCNQTAWAHAAAGKSAATKDGGVEALYTTFSPLNMKDPQSVERFRNELAAWLGTEKKEEKVMSEKTTNVEEPTAAGATEAGAAPVAVEKKRIERGLFKGLFQEEVDERNNTVSFLLACLISALYDWRNQEKDETALDELLGEFHAALKAAMLRDPEAEAYLVYYALNRVPFEQLMKAGARNSEADQQLLHKMHDTLIELGVECKRFDDGEDDGEGEDGEDDEVEKSASVVSRGALTKKVAALETDLSRLREEKSALAGQLELALKVGEQAVENLEVEKAISLAAVTALERFGKEPLPRAGVSVS
jgi:hypothetical protein